MAKYNSLSGTSGRIPAHYPENAPVPPAGSVYMYRNLNDQQLYTVTPGGVHQAIGGGGYILPPATAGTLGGVKTGANVTIAPDGTISVAPPGISTIPVANSVFVSRSGNDGTALVGRYDLPFLTIDAAVAAASAGDTIIVYAGTYATTANLWKNNVSFYFYPGAIVNRGVVGGVFEAVAGETCSVHGHGIFQKGVGEGPVNCVYRSALNANFYIEADIIEHTLGNIALRLDDVAITRVRCNTLRSATGNAISMTSAGGTPDTNYIEIIANVIENSATSSTVPVLSQTGAFDGQVLIKVSEMLGSASFPAGAGGNIIRLSNTGSGNIKIIGDIRSRHTAGGAAFHPLIDVVNFGAAGIRNIFHIIGDITTEFGLGFNIGNFAAGFESTEIRVDGNITCTNDYIIDTTFVPGGFSGSVGSRVFLNGLHKCDNPDPGGAAMRIRQKTTLYLTGRLESASEKAIDKIRATTPDLCRINFANYTMVMSGGGGPVTVFAGVGADTYNVNTSVASNVPPGGAAPPILNGIAGSIDIVDPAVE